MSSMITFIPGMTLFHRLDPRSKIVFMVLISTAIFAVQNLYVTIAILAVMVALWFVAGLPAKVVLGFLRALLPIFIFLVIVQAIFYPGEHILVQPLIPDFVPWIGGMGRITLEGIGFSIILMLRLLSMIILLPLVSMTTPVHIFALGLVKLGLPYHLAYTTTSALNLVPILQNETNVIIDAQRLRAMKTFEKGKALDKARAYPALVTPLVIGAMRHAQSMAVAMDSRAFGANKKRTYIEDIEFKPLDWIFCICTLVFTIAVIAASILL
ncbi:MAG: energy-coupling factor transporter transmembrane protein EcfT [Chloroflexi bacterium]|nr:MAG: energy-coupling factor transporter transmembrane protein EcfT [Chloroflexota bacterium]